MVGLAGSDIELGEYALRMISNANHSLAQDIIYIGEYSLVGFWNMSRRRHLTGLNRIIGPKKIYNEADQVKVIRFPGEYLQQHMKDKSDIVMHAPDGSVKVVDFKISSRASATEANSVAKKKVYLAALAEHIKRLEKEGNKFFIHKPDGSIKRFSTGSFQRTTFLSNLSDRDILSSPDEVSE